MLPGPPVAPITVKPRRPDKSGSKRPASSAKGIKSDPILDWRPWGGGLFSIDDMRAWTEEHEQLFAGLTNELLEHYKISFVNELSLQFSGPGNITVVSNHKNRDAIETLINNSPHLQRLFMFLSATASFLRVVDDNDHFKELYNENPETALDRYDHENAQKSQYEYQVILSGDSVATRFSAAML